MRALRIHPARVTTTDAEIDAAIKKARVYNRTGTKIMDARYLRTQDAVIVLLSTGALVQLPRRTLSALKTVQPKDLSRVEIGPAGATIWFEPGDVGIELEEVLLAAAGPNALKTAGARALGAVTTKKKAEAARLNGKRGGRPRVHRKAPN
jgi:hypothetical protein